ncbi:MAG: RNA polymerase factor sigma-54 [Proteobacteria bacterium]|nr:RNA polymerase factor sigma-54 [Pseudomonadota bacterium]
MPSIRAKQKQSLIITPQLQQAIKLLQMTNLEIQAFLEEQALENPFLEMLGDSASSPDTPDTPDLTANDHLTPSTDSHDQPASLADITPENNALADDPTAHSDLDNRYSSLDAPQKAHSDYDNEGEDRMGRIANPEPGLHAKVISQIDLSIAPKDRAIAYVLTDMLAPTGWLETPLDHISDTTGLPLTRLEAVLASLQSLEPVGVFARNLAECLKIQAIDAGDYDAVMVIILDHLDLLGKGEIGQLARKADCTQDAILSALRLIRSYNPKPGEAYSNDLPPLGEPDVLVRKTAEGWSVDLNRSTLPTLHIRENYADEVTAKLAHNKKVAEDGFVANAVSSARWLKRALEQRNATTLKICAAIISQQQDFLNYGMEALKPMSLKVIAEAVNMHESTISRVTNGTVINTPRGTFSLKAFFSVSIASDQGEGGMAATAVRTRIRNLIDGENPKKPLSDSDIASEISDQGITLARRTVAKYREMMRIPSSSERRRIARMQMIG